MVSVLISIATGYLSLCVHSLGRRVVQDPSRTVGALLLNRLLLCALRHIEKRDFAGSLEALLADNFGYQQPEIAYRFFNFLGGRIHLDSLLLRNESGAHIAAELPMVRRSPQFIHGLLCLELKSLHILSL
jgi:hypothetical protein